VLFDNTLYFFVYHDSESNPESKESWKAFVFAQTYKGSSIEIVSGLVEGRCCPLTSTWVLASSTDKIRHQGYSASNHTASIIGFIDCYTGASLPWRPLADAIIYVTWI
jgi:hypothetical protein